MAYLLGIDVGTSSVKTILLRADGAYVIASAESEYPLLKPKLNYAEQNPDDWWTATIETIQQVLSIATINSQEIRGISLSGQMHGTVCLDQMGKSVRPAIIWADGRSQSQCDLLHTCIPLSQLSNVAPGLPASGFMASTLMWLHEHEPETISQTETVLVPKDYVRYCLTGHIGTDVSDASATWLVDVESGEWSDYLISLCGVEDYYLPPILPSTNFINTLTHEAATALGLPSEISVIMGCADQPAQAIGNGLVDSETLLLTIGTGGQIFFPQSTSIRDSQSSYYVFNHAIPNEWYALSTILAGGLALRWLRDLLGMQSDSYETLSMMASKAPIGSDDLFFIPHLAGERLPLNETPSAGAFIGLQLHHRPEHLIRAVIEGITFAMYSQLHLIHGENAQIIISGGAAQSSLWRQIQADIFGKSLLVGDTDVNHACIGAALIAGIGCGIYSSFEDAYSRLSHPNHAIEPNPLHVSMYLERFEQYMCLYKGIKTLKS